jgi:hypothetical protein
MRRTAFKRKKKGDRFRNRRRDPEKLSWTASEPCHVAGLKGHVCDWPVQVHHIGPERHDDEVIPFCRRAHHDELGQWGKQTFAAHYGITSYSVVARRYHEKYLMRDRWVSASFPTRSEEAWI